MKLWGTGPVDAKVTPELAVFIQLDEMNGRLATLTSLMEQMTAQGRRRTIRLSVTTIPQRVSFEAIGYSMFNDWAGTVYTGDTPNVDTGTLAGGLAAAESESVDLKRRQLVDFWVVCASGTATLRIRYHV